MFVLSEDIKKHVSQNAASQWQYDEYFGVIRFQLNLKISKYTHDAMCFDFARQHPYLFQKFHMLLKELLEVSYF